MRAQIERQMESAASAAALAAGRETTVGLAPAATPEKEMERRRRIINDAHRDFMKMSADARAPVGSASSTSGGQKPPAKEGPKGADAQAKNGSEEVAVSFRSIPEPPRAIGVEGRVVIKGGQADAKAPRDDGAGVKYTVEEHFTGNLIIADVEPEEEPSIENAVARGKLSPKETAEASSAGSGEVERATPKSTFLRDYQMDTVSTGIKVISLDGGACVRSNGRSGGECLEKDPFIKKNVSENNRYGNFNDGVVAAQREGDKVKIEVSAPDVIFSTLTGMSKAELRCSRAVFEMGMKEFKQLVENGSMTLSKQWTETDSASSGCRPGSTITLHMKVNGK